ncbi:MAG: hypothetical protein RL549_1417, partial [Verrucomicrobiota bacterium]
MAEPVRGEAEFPKGVVVVAFVIQ